MKTVCDRLKVKAYGKINLMLDIVGKRQDGYHMLNTVMQSVDCYDLLDIELCEGEGIELICDKEGFPLDEKNLIHKAVTAFQKHTGIDYGCKIRVTVEKNLPSMAGMGGGSSDCAAMLNALNFLFDTRLSDDELCRVGVTLGADVPFCIVGGTQLCQGVGEILHRLPSPQCKFLIIKPDVGISTPEAYKAYDSIVNPKRCSIDMFVQSLGSSNIYSLCANMFNALEYAHCPDEVTKAKDDLKRAGALQTLMTGSGSAVFGIFDNDDAIKRAYNSIDGYVYKQICCPVRKGCEFV